MNWSDPKAKQSSMTGFRWCLVRRVRISSKTKDWSSLSLLYRTKTSWSRLQTFRRCPNDQLNFMKSATLMLLAFMQQQVMQVMIATTPTAVREKATIHKVLKASQCGSLLLQSPDAWNKQQIYIRNFIKFPNYRAQTSLQLALWCHCLLAESRT